MPAEVDRKKRDKRRHNPDYGDGRQGPAVCDEAIVMQRTAHVDVPVEADRAQVEDRRRRAHDVGRHPDATGASTEQPPARHVVDDRERHHGGGHQGVGQRQRHDEIVAGPAEISVRHNRNDHQQISGQGDDYEQRQQESEDQLSEPEADHGRRRRRYAVAVRTVEILERQPPIRTVRIRLVRQRNNPQVHGAVIRRFSANFGPEISSELITSRNVSDGEFKNAQPGCLRFLLGWSDRRTERRYRQHKTESHSPNLSHVTCDLVRWRSGAF